MLKPRVILAIVLIAALAALLITHAVNSRKLLDVSDDLLGIAAPVFAKSGLKDANMTKSLVEMKKLGARRYLQRIREYTVAKTFELSDFESALKARLKFTRFRLVRRGQASSKYFDSTIYDIYYGRFAVLTLQLNKKKVITLPKITKKFDRPKVAIVMDDFGYNMMNVRDIIAIRKPVTMSILPNLKYSSRIAEQARASALEVIMHLPLESHRKDVKEEADTINSKMTPEEVIARLREDIETVPALRGVSNHMGSKSTEEKPLMTIIMKELKARGLYFFDSLTSEHSVCGEVARYYGVKYAKRDIFLDNSNNIEDIRKQVLEMRKIAFRRGRVIAVCHDRKNTVKVLAETMPDLASEGIDFVYLSDMVK